MLSASADASNSAVTHVHDALLSDWMRPERTRVLTSTTTLKETGKCIVYWMQRDVRTVDNWALLHACHMAKTAKVPLLVLFYLPPPPETPSDDSLPPTMMEMRITECRGSFLLGGLEHVHAELSERGMPLHMLLPPSHDAVGSTVVNMLDQCQSKVVVCDMNPLRPFRQWMEEQAAPLFDARKIPLHQVDAHNVVPV
jgi:deoxyribodipyrimidine photo-lyase